MAAGMGAVTVSLDGLEASHDWMRGVPGSYARALRAIGIIAAEPRLNADVVTCVNRRNLSELPEIYEILKGLGVKQWRLFTIIPIGRAAADPEMKLADSQFVSLMEFIQAKRQEGGPMKVTFSCEGYLGRYEETTSGISAAPASTSRPSSSTAASAPAPTSTGTASPRGASIRTISTRFGRTASRLSASGTGPGRADARTARPGATASETGCTIGTMAPEKSSSATMQKRCLRNRNYLATTYLCSVSRTAPGPAYSSRTIPSMRSPRPAS